MVFSLPGRDARPRSFTESEGICHSLRHSAREERKTRKLPSSIDRFGFVPRTDLAHPAMVKQDLASVLRVGVVPGVHASTQVEPKVGSVHEEVGGTSRPRAQHACRTDSGLQQQQAGFGSRVQLHDGRRRGCDIHRARKTSQLQATLDARQVVTPVDKPWTPPANLSSASGTFGHRLTA